MPCWSPACFIALIEETILMTNLRQDFSRYFQGNPNRKFKCSKCLNGQWIPAKDTFHWEEPKHSRNEHEDNDWEPEWISYRFSYRCYCDNELCGEIANVLGIGKVCSSSYYDGCSEYFDEFEILSIIPSPDIIKLPENISKEVRLLILRSFSLYWLDPSAAANAIRASLEALLDDLKIPRKIKNEKGKVSGAVLDKRLKMWGEKNGTHAELCLALKEVGNFGSHGANVPDNVYIQTLELYEYVLTELYDNKADKAKKNANSIRAQLKMLQKQ